MSRFFSKASHRKSRFSGMACSASRANSMSIYNQHIEKKIILKTRLGGGGICHFGIKYSFICKDIYIKNIPQCYQKTALSLVQTLPPPPRRQKQKSIIKPNRYCKEDVYCSVSHSFTLFVAEIPRHMYIYIYMQINGITCKIKLK